MQITNTGIPEQLTGRHTGKNETIKSGKSNFSGLLSQAIGAAEEASVENQRINAELLAGETDDLHTALIASQKAQLTLSLAVQIRNKAVDAYNDIMRMQL